MHPEDADREEMRKLLERLKQINEEDRIVNVEAKAKLEVYVQVLKSLPIPEVYKTVMDAIVALIEQIAKNRLDIQDLTQRFYESTELLQNQIDILSDKVAGLDKYK